MCLQTDFADTLAAPQLERHVTDDAFERTVSAAPVDARYESGAMNAMQGPMDPSWFSGTFVEQPPMYMQGFCGMPSSVVVMPVFVNIPTMVPVPVYMNASHADCGLFVPEQLENVSLKAFESRHREAYRIQNTFIHVDEESTSVPAKRRSASCPADLRRMRHPRTTVCLRNLPNRTKVDRVEAHLKTLGCGDAEAVHMPMDKKTLVNKGYAFIKFHDEDAATDFIASVEGTRIQGSQSSKRLTASFAARQGPAFLVNLPSKPSLTSK